MTWKLQEESTSTCMHSQTALVGGEETASDSGRIIPGTNPWYPWIGGSVNSESVWMQWWNINISFFRKPSRSHQPHNPATILSSFLPLECLDQKNPKTLMSYNCTRLIGRGSSVGIAHDLGDKPSIDCLSIQGWGRKFFPSQHRSSHCSLLSPRPLSNHYVWLFHRL